MPYLSAYPNFQLRVASLSAQCWVPLSIIYDAVNQLTLLYFPVQTARDSGHATLATLCTSVLPPYVYNGVNDTRFSGGYFVNLSTPLLNQLVSQLLAALQFKDRMFQKTNVGNVRSSETSNSPAYLAAFASYTNALRVLRDTISDPTYIWDRSRFETENGLTWV